MVVHVTLLGTIIVCAGAYYIYSRREQLKKKIINARQKRGKHTSIKEAEAEVIKAYLPHANSFDGLYEPLYKGAKGLRNKERMLNTLNEWSIRMRSVARESPELRSWWDAVVSDVNNLDVETIQTRMNVVLALLKKGGVIRDSRSELVADEDTSLYYTEADDEIWSVGDKLKVDSPCWYLLTTPPRIIEKGYCILNNK